MLRSVVARAVVLPVHPVHFLLRMLILSSALVVEVRSLFENVLSPHAKLNDLHLGLALLLRRRLLLHRHRSDARPLEEAPVHHPLRMRD